ncbi:BA14K family protein [Alsobacter sp. KACC 23698]|uniref:Lectin-like protein BA14k n=1 Tax=Alsobacter sp. KACC 23698 TaxID=3149229 RepID=A0AAU7JHE6_9HYPH
MTHSFKTGLVALGALTLSAGLALAQSAPQLGAGAGGGVPGSVVNPGGRASGMSAGGVSGGAGAPTRMRNGYAYDVSGMDTGVIVQTPGGMAETGPSMNWKWEQCAKLYKTFDPQSGTFIGEDGLRHLCQ